MPKNPNLIPTTVTDKNGKVTTVHRKPQATVTGSSIPAPVGADAERAIAAQRLRDLMAQRVAFADRVIELYDATHQSGFDYTPHVRREIDRYPSKELDFLEPALEGDTELSRGVAEQIVHGVGTPLIKEVIHYYRKTNSDNYWRTASGVRAMAEYPEIRNITDLRVADEETQNKVVALMKMADLIDTPQSPLPFLEYRDSDHYDMRVITDEPLVRLVMNRPDDVEKIAELVLKYRTPNAAAINGMLEGEHPTMAEGFL